MENFFWVCRPYSKPAPPLPPKTEIFYFMMPLCFGWPETSTKLGPRCLSRFVRFLYSDFQIATLLCKPKHLAIFFNIEISFWFFFNLRFCEPNQPSRRYWHPLRKSHYRWPQGFLLLKPLRGSFHLLFILETATRGFYTFFTSIWNMSRPIKNMSRLIWNMPKPI